MPKNNRPVGIPKRRADLRADPEASARVLDVVASLPSAELRRITSCFGPFDTVPDAETGVPAGIPGETALAELRRRKIPGSRQSRREARQSSARRREK